MQNQGWTVQWLCSEKRGLSKWLSSQGLARGLTIISYTFPLQGSEVE